MELKIKQLEQKIESQQGEINSLKSTHEEFLIALELIQKMVENDALYLKQLGKIIENRYTETKIYDFPQELSVL